MDLVDHTVGVGWALKLNQLAPGAGGPFASRQGEVSTERGLRRGVERAVLGARASRRRVRCRVGGSRLVVVGGACAANQTLSYLFASVDSFDRTTTRRTSVL